MGRITAKSTLRYFLLPGIVPWARSVLFSGFHVLAYYMALIFASLRLLPKHHEFLNPRNIGNYGVFSVIRTTAKNIKFEWIRIDQVVVFSAVVIGVILAFLYIISLVMYITVGPVFAQSFSSLFVNPNPREDIALMMMDRTFGIPGIFDTKVITESGMPQPTPFQTGMLTLFSFFSYGMLLVAFIILLYYVVEIVVETSITGTPFGRRFENAFVPIRIVAAIGMLIPLSYGLNSAQWMTLYIAKFGSNLATNAWAIYNSGLDNPMGLENAELVAKPVPPNASGLMKDLFLIRTCMDTAKKVQSFDAHTKIRAEDRAAGTTPEPGTITAVGVRRQIKVFMIPDSSVVAGGKAFDLLRAGEFKNRGRDILAPGKEWPSDYNGNVSKIYEEALRLSAGKDIKLVVGKYSEEAEINNEYPGGIIPVCGEITIPASASLRQDNNEPIRTNVSTYTGQQYFAAVLKVLTSIEEGDSDWSSVIDKKIFEDFKLASDRYLYLNTNFRNAWNGLFPGEDDSNLEGCFNDDENDGIDNYAVSNNAGNVDVNIFGRCDQPIPPQFYRAQLETYASSFSTSGIYGYDFLTGRGQEYLDQVCTRARSYESSCNAMRDNAAKQTCQENIKKRCTLADDYRRQVTQSIYYKDLGLPNPLSMSDNDRITLLRYGWGGAGLWFRYVAEVNGDLINAVNAMPSVTKFPLLLEQIKESRQVEDGAVSPVGCERYNPQTAANGVVDAAGSFGRDLAGIYYGICNELNATEALQPVEDNQSYSQNFIMTMLDTLFGAQDLFNFRDNTAVHPLAQLSALGKTLIDRTMRNMFTAYGAAFGGGLVSFFGSIMGAIRDTAPMGQLVGAFGEIGKAVSGIFMTFAMITLTAGVLLYYVLPMLPFMHFFFAVARWVKTIFEALVGVPLWALAHMRMEGEGLPSKASSAGYFMLLEIFLRPILTVFSLLGAMGAFAASAYILNVSWGLITNNLIGYDPVTQISNDVINTTYYRPKVDQFFFTIMYIIMVYMIATGSFKMIDLIPDGIMKWLSDTKTFGASDNADDYVDQTSSWIAMPTVMYGNQIGGKLVDLAYQVPAGAGSAIGGLMRMGQTEDDQQNQGEEGQQENNAESPPQNNTNTNNQNTTNQEAPPSNGRNPNTNREASETPARASGENEAAQEQPQPQPRANLSDWSSLLPESVRSFFRNLFGGAR